MNSLSKWLMFNSIVVAITTYLVQFYDAFNYLQTIDPTYVTSVILFVYVWISIYLGLKRENANLEAVRYHANRLPAIGMVGTLIGIMMVLNEASHVAQPKLSDFVGLPTVFITTLFGIFFMLLVNYQTAFVLEDYRDAE